MMPRISRRLLLIGLLVVALLCGLGVLVSLRSAATEKDQIRTRIRSLATSAAATTERYVMGKIDILRTIAGLQPFRQGNVAGMSATLGQIDAEGRGFSQGMAWIDRSGRVRAPRSIAPVDVTDRSYVEKVLTTGRPYVSEAIVGRIRSSVIVFAVPTFDASGDVNGVLTGGTRLADLDLLAPSLEFAGAEIRLVDRDGNLLTGQPASAGPTPVSPRSPYREMRKTRLRPRGGGRRTHRPARPDHRVCRPLRRRTGSSVSPSRGLARSPVRRWQPSQRADRPAAAALVVRAVLVVVTRWIAAAQAAEDRRRRAADRLRETAAALLAAVDAESIGAVVAAAARDELGAKWAAILARVDRRLVGDRNGWRPAG